MTLASWLGLVALFFSGGLTPGPAVLLVMASSLRHGVRPAMAAAWGIAAANWVWIALAVSGVLALAAAAPTAFTLLRYFGVGVILVLAVVTAFQNHAPVRLEDQEAPRRSRLFGRGVALQLANPAALMFFAFLLPPFFNPDAPIAPQALIVAVTVTATELFGLFVYAVLADSLARRFTNPRFARVFYLIAGALMAISAVIALAAGAG